MSGSPYTDVIKPASPTFLRRSAECTAESESQSAFPFLTANGGGAKSKWVGQQVAPPIGRPYAAISLANTSSLVCCPEICLPGASRSLANRRDYSVVGSAWGVQSHCWLLTVVPLFTSTAVCDGGWAGLTKIFPGLLPLLEEVSFFLSFLKKKKKKRKGLAPLCASFNKYSWNKPP